MKPAQFHLIIPHTIISADGYVYMKWNVYPRIDSSVCMIVRLFGVSDKEIAITTVKQLKGASDRFLYLLTTEYIMK